MLRKCFPYLGLIGVLSLGLGLALGVAFKGQAPGPSATSNCVPGFRILGEEPLELEVGKYWIFGVSSALIGCRDNLEAMTSQDLMVANMAISEFVRRRHLLFLRNAMDAEIRKLARDAINQELGDDIVSDVFFFEVNFSEIRPLP